MRLQDSFRMRHKSTCHSMNSIERHKALIIVFTVDDQVKGRWKCTSITLCLLKFDTAKMVSVLRYIKPIHVQYNFPNFPLLHSSIELIASCISHGELANIPATSGNLATLVIQPLSKSLTLIPPPPLSLLPSPAFPIPDPRHCLRSVFSINNAAVASWSSSSSLLAPCLGVAARDNSRSEES